MKSRFSISAKLPQIAICVWSLIVVAGARTGHAQPTDYGRYQVRIMPLRTIDPVNPGLELQGEVLLAPRFSFQASGAAYFEVLPNADYETFGGGRALGAVKIYFDKNWKEQKANRTYMMMEGGYSAASFWRTGEFSTNRDPNRNGGLAPYQELYYTRRNATLLNLRLGVQLLTKRISTDFSAGVGMKDLEVRHIGRSRPTHELVRGAGGISALREQRVDVGQLSFCGERRLSVRALIKKDSRWVGPPTVWKNRERCIR